MLQVFETVYWPSLDYILTYKRFLDTPIGPVLFKKQFYKNRCEILSANGKQRLTIPIHARQGQSDIEIRICNRSAWQKNHLRSLDSAYNNAPFYWYYKPAIHDFYTQSATSLFELNKTLLQWLFPQLGLPKPQFTEEMGDSIFEKTDYAHRLRVILNTQAYPQTFSNKFEFIPNLSVLDLLFNTGPQSSVFIQNCLIKGPLS